MLSIPLSVYTSRVSLGRKLRAARLFVIPEELDPPEEIRSMTQTLKSAGAPPGFIEAVVDPVINALVCAAGVARFNPTGPLRDQRPQLLLAALRDGPKKLSTTRKVRLLTDPVALSELHMLVWTSPDAHASWREAVAANAQVIEFPRRKPPRAELTSAA